MIEHLGLGHKGREFFTICFAEANIIALCSLRIEEKDFLQFYKDACNAKVPLRKLSKLSPIHNDFY